MFGARLERTNIAQYSSTSFANFEFRFSIFQSERAPLASTVYYNSWIEPRELSSRCRRHSYGWPWRSTVWGFS